MERQGFFKVSRFYFKAIQPSRFKQAKRQPVSQRFGLQTNIIKTQGLWMGRAGKWDKSEWTYTLVRRLTS